MGHQRFRARLAKMFNRSGWRILLLLLPSSWLLLFFVFPFIVVLAISFAAPVTAMPPFRFADHWPFLDGEWYAKLLTNGLYIRAYANTIGNAVMTTLLCLLIGYPMALYLVRVSNRTRNILLVLVILPFWTSFILRVYAWMGLFGASSWLNKLLTAVWNSVSPESWHLASLPIANTSGAVLLVMVYTYLPFMILPLYAALDKLDGALDEAAMDLGSRPVRVFFDITLPLSKHGIIAGSLLVFIPSCGEMVIPNLVGNASSPLFGQIVADLFLKAHNWPLGATAAVLLLLTLVLPIVVFNHGQERSLINEDGS